MLVPLVVVALVLVNVLRPDADDDTTGGPVADVSGTPSSGRDDLPVLDVDTPEVTPAADLACPVLMQQLPPELAGEPSRMVRSDSPYAYAWGDPAIVLICGVAPPAGYVVGAGTLVVSGVEWYVDTSDPDAVVWTTVDRTVPVEVRVPADQDSAGPTALSTVIANALPYTEPVPAGG